MPATGFQVISILYAHAHPILTAGLGGGYDFSCPVYVEEEVESQEMAIVCELSSMGSYMYVNMYAPPAGRALWGVIDLLGR